jgi:hypothetical protein
MSSVIDEYGRFVDVVEKMRAAQVAYFKCRGGLDDCKKLERAVDRLVQEYHELNREAAQSRMF